MFLSKAHEPNCLVLVQTRKTHPVITEKSVDWDVKNQTKSKPRTNVLEFINVCYGLSAVPQGLVSWILRERKIILYSQTP